ncbi:MAG: peptidylprolyl isomerase [Bacteroidetes bacterium 4572_77]|nr:MAG: peptidylprolyl isomerase [Bacteroidetes bacterium 4572_77]
MEKLIFITLVLIMVSSCSHTDTSDKKSSKISKKEINKYLLDANKHLLKVEDRNIRNFIARYQYQMKETGSGLFYEIYKKGNGEKAQKGKIADLSYRVRLLNGETIYDSSNEGIKEFLIGQGNVESGLEEGILLLSVGDNARFIIPSHLAFGLLGDLNKIPKKSVLIYDIELLNLKDR